MATRKDKVIFFNNAWNSYVINVSTVNLYLLCNNALISQSCHRFRSRKTIEFRAVSAMEAAMNNP